VVSLARKTVVTLPRNQVVTLSRKLVVTLPGISTVKLNLVFAYAFAPPDFKPVDKLNTIGFSAATMLEGWVILIDAISYIIILL
jgi:hypothetical protein